MDHLTHLLVILLFPLAVLTSSQDLYSAISINKTPSNQNSIDLHYLDACTAILKGLKYISTDRSDLWYYFAEWQNMNPTSTLIDGYFENNKGIISKSYVDNYYDDTWTINLVLHDGSFVDTKRAEFQIYIENVQNNTTLNQANGTWTTTNTSMLFTVYYGENFETKSQTDITGQVSIYFLNPDTNKPFSQIGKNDNSVGDYSVQLSFKSSDGSFSFDTSIFTTSYMTASNNVVAALFVFISLIVSVISWYFEDLHDQVTFGNLQAFYASASYIGIWVFAQKGYYGFFFFALLVPAWINWWKFFYFTLRKIVDVRDDFACTGLLLTFVFGALNFVPTIWINLFPSFVLLLPFFQKLYNIKHNPHYMTRFEVSNLLYVLLWATYAYNYSGNFYRISPKKLMFFLSFCCIVFQFIVLLILEIRGSKIAKQPLLVDDKESQKDQTTTPGPVTNAKPAKQNQYETDPLNTTF